MPFETKPNTVDVVIRRTIDLSLVPPLDEDRASSEDGIALNLAYVDVREWGIEDAELMVEHEREFLELLASVGWTTDEAAEIIDELMSDGSELFAFDPGIGAAVFSLAAAGATPISSCNGGTIGQDRHADDVPNILIAGGPAMHIAAIKNALAAADLGIIPNGEFAEIFADDVLKFHTFADRLVSELKSMARE